MTNCISCNGNDGDAPCAYPSEGKPGCLRDKRMSASSIVNCNHVFTCGREGEKGSWCVDCGVKVWDVDDRECKDCKHFFRGAMGYTGCNKHLMAVVPDMHVTYNIENGTCWSSC